MLMAPAEKASAYVEITKEALSKAPGPPFVLSLGFVPQGRSR